MDTTSCIREMVEAVEQAAKEPDGAVTEPLQDLLKKLAGPLPTDLADRLLSALRAGRKFEPMARTADALIGLGTDVPSVRRQYAQALIELGQFTVAEMMLQQLARDLDAKMTVDRERSEARGLLGRLHKQRFVEFSARPELAQRELVAAVRAYEQAYPLDKAWHGSNLVALAHRAEQMGIQLESGLKSRDVARSVLQDLAAEETWSSWSHAAAGEAYLALDDPNRALAHYGRFAQHPECDAFALGSATRQLREIWGIRPGTEGTGPILVALETRAVAGGMGGSLGSTPNELAELESALTTDASELALEAVLGENRTQTIETMLSLLGIARSVCKIVNRYLHAQRKPSGGSGFLLDGGLLHDSWQGKPVIVTNRHVLSEQRESYSGTATVPRSEADAVFEFWGGKPTTRTFAIDAILATVSPAEGDFTVATLKDPAPALDQVLRDVCLDANVLVAPDQKPPSRIYLVGHPNGRGLEYSLSDNEVLDHELTDPAPPRGHRRIHYKAPTEHGMSGSPLLAADRIQVIGLHHASTQVPLRAGANVGSYRANEAVWIASIRELCARVVNDR